MGGNVNWHAYKVFKNGKRAKAALTSFEYSGNEEQVKQYFETEIKKNFNEKNRGLEFVLLREDEPQERKEKNTDENLRKQVLVLNQLAKDVPRGKNKTLVGGLIFASATNWNWQWCALEPGTNNFVAPLSPPFDNPMEAHTWMQYQITHHLP